METLDELFDESAETNVEDVDADEKLTRAREVFESLREEKEKAGVQDKFESFFITLVQNFDSKQVERIFENAQNPRSLEEVYDNTLNFMMHMSDIYSIIEGALFNYHLIENTMMPICEDVFDMTPIELYEAYDTLDEDVFRDMLIERITPTD